jgi:hypothetical protein
MLIGNYSVLSKDPGRSIGGGSIGLGLNRGDRNKTSMSRGPFNAVDWEPKSGVPDGYRNPYAWVMPQTAGGLSARNSVVGAGSISTTALAVRLAQAALTGSGELTAIGGLIVQLVAAINGSGEISDADLKAFLQAVAALSGSGEISDADLEGLGALLAALTASGTAAGSTLTGSGELAADLTVSGTGLTTSNVGAAVWGAVASANNDAGTMGEKLNDAGSASNPWTEVIESGYTAAEILRLLAAVAQGSATGLESASPVFKSIDGTKDRVTATYDAGERTVTGRDAS